jgi:MFS transporter, Spinster family, sphingosine-1-phosphate transporter
VKTPKNVLLSVLVLILAFNAMDRMALGLMLQDIKADLRLSDTQLGFLTGLAFAVFYSIMGIPLARWADRGNRVLIISLTTALWSAAVALCGLASQFTHLLLIRIGVAVGEAGCIPPAHSLIADHFDRAERPRAVARYMLGKPLSIVIGFFIAGWLNEIYGWRVTFIVLGLPGIVLAGIAWRLLKEPRVASAPSGLGAAAVRAELPRATTAHASASACPVQPTIRDVWLTLSASATFRHLLLCFSVAAFFSYGISQWQAAFFIRSYGLRTGELGTWFALIYGLGGLAGTYLGGEWASRRAAGNEPLQLRAMALVYSVFALVSACVYLAPDKHLAFALLLVSAVGGATIHGPLFATIQTLVPERMRAMSLAVIYLFANLIGMGLGPLAVGALSDGLRALLGADSLRVALLALCPGYLWVGWHLWRASLTVTRDLDAVSK